MTPPSFTIRNGVLSMGSKRVRLDHVSTWELGTNHIIITVHGRMETIQAGQESKLIAEAMDGYFAQEQEKKDHPLVAVQPKSLNIDEIAEALEKRWTERLAKDAWLKVTAKNAEKEAAAGEVHGEVGQREDPNDSAPISPGRGIPAQPL